MVIINIKKSLGTFELDASLRFGSEMVVLTGPNGSGKTTLLNVVAGLEEARSGCISVKGRVFLDGASKLPPLPPEERNVGYVSHEGSLFPWLTVRENVSFGLDSEARINHSKLLLRLYAELDLDRLLDRYPRHLSGGEAQRVTLARALAPMPSMLLLDEPFSAVDVELRPRLRGFLLELQREWEIPAIIVSHDPAEAHTLGDRIFTLTDGRITGTEERGRLSKMPFVSY